MKDSQLFGGGIPIGSSTLALDAPVSFTSNGQEFLRAGSIKAYDASYAVAIAAAPQLRVFGNDAKTYGVIADNSAPSPRYYYIGGSYIGVTTSMFAYGAALNSLSSLSAVFCAPVKRCAVNGTAHLVVPYANANTALQYTSNGSAFAAVGGTFTTLPIPKAVAFGNNSWLSLSAVNNIAGEQAYINNANPSGAWTVGTTGLAATMTSVNALNYGTGVFVAVGTSATATAGKIATCAAVGGAWTDRTAASGVTFAAGEAILDGVFDGTAHVLVTSTGRILTSTDGINYVARGTALDISSNVPQSGAISWAQAVGVGSMELTTDGAGTVVLQQGGTPNVRNILAVSLDHGATWSAFQAYSGKAGNGTSRTISYANGRWIENHSGNIQSLVDIGPSLITPDYIGQQSQQAAGQFVRIK
ncbi:hypothetical protein [Herminiimonas sp. CN]|uniref:hypothetical protein n=1 Tax=Herminiimonas sp. CN TaxID=1349818 RepID=UPI000473F051|nr:hypothetical protein [Herminiimonas sp. CN]